MSTLSVETSSSASSTSTESPGCLSHRVTVPSVTLSPSWGSVTSVPSPEDSLVPAAGGCSGWALSSSAESSPESSSDSSLDSSPESSSASSSSTRPRRPVLVGLVRAVVLQPAVEAPSDDSSSADASSSGASSASSAESASSSSPPPSDSEESPTMASSAPTSTVSSSLTLISSRVPATGEGISVSTLSVETSSSASSTSTESPGCFSHRVTVPSVTLSPSCGSLTGVAIGVCPVFSSVRERWSAVRREHAAACLRAPAKPRRATRSGWGERARTVRRPRGRPPS